MAFCKRCGSELEDDSDFCTECGTQVTKKSNERKIVYEGEIHKCPNCGEVLKSFIANCPACGFEIRNTKSSNSVQEFAEKIEKLEQDRVVGSKTNSFSRALFGQKPSKTDEQEISLIKSFPIPNTKEDLYEFFILSQSNIDIEVYSSENGQVNQNDVRMIVSNAWKSKFEQAYQKSKIIFKNDPRLEEIQKLYDETNKNIIKAKTKIWKIFGFVFGGLIVFYIILFLLISVIPDRPESETRHEHLQYVVEEIEEDISNGDYKSARNKAYTLTYDESLDEEKHIYWEKKQEDILEQIDKAEGGK